MNLRKIILLRERNFCTHIAKIRGLIFSSYLLHDYDKIPTDLFKSIVPDSLLSMFMRNISEPELDFIFARGLLSVGLIATPFIPIGLFAVMLKQIIERLFASDDNISLSEIEEVYRKYDKDPNVIKDLNRTIEKIIDKNDSIKIQITENVKSFCDNCAEQLMKIGVTSLSI